VAQVIRAANFAAEAHEGQFRRTKEPYITHCIETGAQISEALAPAPSFVCALLLAPAERGRGGVEG